MTFNATYRTYLLCFALICSLIQTPDWAYIPQALGFLCVFGICIEYLANHCDKKLSVTPLTLFVIGYVGICMSSVMWSDVLYHSIAVLPLYCLLPMMLIIMAGKDNALNYDLFFRIVNWIFIGVAIAAIGQFYLGLGVYDNHVNYPFLNPNSLAVFLGCGLIYTVYSLLFRKSYIHISSVVVLIFAIVVTWSEGAILSIIGVCLFMVLMMVKPKVFWTIVFSLLVAVMSLIIFTDAITEILIKSGSRMPIWQSAIETALATNPYIGNGIGTFRDVFKDAYLDVIEGVRVTMGMHAHNDVLHLWVEIGLVGLLFVFGIVTILLIQSLRQIFIQKNNEIILPVSILLYCGMMAMITPVIILSSVLIIIGLRFFRLPIQAPKILPCPMVIRS